MEQSIFALRGDLDGDLVSQTIDTNQYIGLMFSGNKFLLPLSKIQEIIMLPKITPVPNTPTHFHGVFNLRGRILPLINFHLILGIQSEESSQSSRLILLKENDPQRGEIEFGVIVDAITDVEAIPEENLKEQNLISGGLGADYIELVSINQKNLVGVLSLNKIMTRL